MAIRNLTAGKIRHLPVAQADLDRMYAILQGIDPTLSLDIVSGAQPAGGGTGSHRHDVDETGFGHTADVVFSRNGQEIMPGQDKALYTRFIQAAAPEFPGIGHYNWGIHVGGGKPAFWGPDTTSATADPAFAAAYSAGRGSAQAGQAPPAQPALAGQGFQPALADIVAPTSVQPTAINPMANVGLGFLQRAEERRDREEEDARERRLAMFSQPFGLAGLYG